MYVRAVNFYLPPDIAVKAAFGVRDDFDPRRHAVSRTYVYKMDCGEVRSPLRRWHTYHLGRPIAVDEMVDASEEFVGVHDFGRFAGPLEQKDAGTVRQILDIAVRQCGDLVETTVVGNAFLPHQVRRMAGALADVGLGRLTRSQIRSMLEGDASGAVARALPPEGLCLVHVRYADFLA